MKVTVTYLKPVEKEVEIPNKFGVLASDNYYSLPLSWAEIHALEDEFGEYLDKYVAPVVDPEEEWVEFVTVKDENDNVMAEW